MDEDGGRYTATCHDAIPNVRFASELQALRHPATSIDISKQLRISLLTNNLTLDKHISTPYALPFLPNTPAHLPHRHKHDRRLLPLKSRTHSRPHHLQHTTTRTSLPIYAKHPLPRRAFRFIQQHGGQHKLSCAEDGGRVASPAIARYNSIHPPHVAYLLTPSQSNSVSSVRKAPKPPAQATTISTTPPPASTPAPPATRLSTKRTTNSTRDAAGLPSGTPYLALWDNGQILASA